MASCEWSRSWLHAQFLRSANFIHSEAFQLINFLIPGIVNDFFKKILVRGYLLNKDKWREFEAIINSMIWPSGTGRLPTNVCLLCYFPYSFSCWLRNQLGQNHSLNKADQLRQWVRIQPMVLWLCWRDKTGHIPHVEPPIPANRHMPNFRCHSDDVYKQALYLSIADHIIAPWSITQEEVTEGIKYLTLYNWGALAMRWPMVINNHLSMHYPDSFLHGPINSWWLMGFEHCNGNQKKVNLNGHAEGAEMELTLARSWVQKHRLYELVLNGKLN